MITPRQTTTLKTAYLTYKKLTQLPFSTPRMSIDFSKDCKRYNVYEKNICRYLAIQTAIYQTVPSIDRHHSLQTPWCNTEYKLSGTHALVLQMVCRLVRLTTKKAQRTNAIWTRVPPLRLSMNAHRDLPRVSAYLINEDITQQSGICWASLGGTIVVEDSKLGEKEYFQTHAISSWSLRTYWVSKQPDYGEPVPCDRKIISRRHKIIRLYNDRRVSRLILWNSSRRGDSFCGDKMKFCKFAKRNVAARMQNKTT
jgi:hypothetical protein